MQPRVIFDVNREEFMATLKFISHASDYIILNFLKDGMHIVHIDPAHVMLLRSDAETLFFKEYQHSQDSKFMIDFDSLISTMEDLEEKFINFSWDGEHLTLTAGNFTRQYDPLFFQFYEPKVPELSFERVCEVSKNEVCTVSREARKFNDNIELSFKNGDGCAVLEMHSQLDKIREVLDEEGVKNIKRKRFARAIFPCEPGKEVYSMFPIEYFDDAVSSMSGETLFIHMANVYPVKIISKSYGLTESVLLSPRKESE